MATVFMGCGKLIYTNEYRDRLASLSPGRDPGNFALLSKKELNKHKLFIHGKDTVRVKAGKRTFAIQDLVSKDIYVFQHNESGINVKVECDSAWTVKHISLFTRDY